MTHGCQIILPPHIELKIAEVDETDKSQAKKHCSVAAEWDDDAHNHWSESLSKV